MLTAAYSRASSPSRAIAEHIAQIDRGQIPQAALYGAKQSILDTVGVMIAATGLVPAAADLSALICELGGRPTSTVLGVRLPDLAAAHRGVHTAELGERGSGRIVTVTRCVPVFDRLWR
jgi:hypothetical protein